MQNRNDVNRQLIEAAKNGQTEAIRAALEAGADINYIDATDPNGKTALLWALVQGLPGVAYLLLEQGQGNIQINYKIKNGLTALKWVACHGYTEVLRLILAHPEVDVNVTDQDGYTALDWACAKGQVSVVRLMIEKKEIWINGMSEQKQGFAPLMHAAHNGETEVMRLLFNRPDIALDQVSTKGNSPLFFACLGGQVKAVRLLLSKGGFDIGRVNEDGETALGAAFNKKHVLVVRELLNHFVETTNDPDLRSDYEETYKALESVGDIRERMSCDILKRTLKKDQIESIQAGLNQINYLLNSIKALEKQKVRILMFAIINEHIQSVLDFQDIDTIKKEREKLELVLGETQVLLGRVDKDNKAEKQPKKELLLLMEKVLVREGVQDRDALLGQFKRVLDIANKNPKDVNSVIFDELLNKLSLYQISVLNIFLKTLTLEQRKTLKDVLFKAIKSMNNKRLGGDDARLMTEVHNRYVGNDQTALFEIFRMGDHDKVGHDTGTWANFCNLMKKERYMPYINKVGTFKVPGKGGGDATLDAVQLNRPDDNLIFEL